MTKQTSSMAFYHADGFVPAYRQAIQFAGKDGRIATMPDVVDARLTCGINDEPWNTYYTTVSAEYFGYSRGGVRILIIAHGVGPMATLEGIQQAYSFQYKDNSRGKRGGRITDQQFRDLEEGKYGEVQIVEFDPIISRYEYPFLGYLSLEEALFEPLLKARLGSRADEYLMHHARMATRVHLEEHGTTIPNPYIVEMGAASNCPYQVGGWGDIPRTFPMLNGGNGAIAHLLSTGGLCNVHHERERRVPSSIANYIGCHEWSNGVRLIGVRSKGPVSDIHTGPDSHKLLRSQWQKLMRPVTQRMPLGFCVLMNIGEELFTQYPKMGERMDNYEPEFKVTSTELIGEPVEFVTTVGGYHGFFKYGIKEVNVLAPPTANAYKLAGEPEIIWTDGNPTHHKVLVQFYKVEADTSQRLIREEELRNNYDLMMELVEAQ